MKICIVAEGCYPYVVGGVSGWIHSMINSFPEHEYIVLSIVAGRENSGKFVYNLPDNVTAVYEAYLNDMDWGIQKKNHSKRLNKKDFAALRSVMLNDKVDWDGVFDLFQSGRISVDELLMGPDFLKIAQDLYDKHFSQIVFSDFLWTLRSLYLPTFMVLRTHLPEADLYHCVATGYAGMLGAMAKHLYGCSLLISEHGIYTREREEELLRAKWVSGIYKNIWIEQFQKMSLIAYDRADIITSLYHHARQLQIGLGAAPEKLRVTPNGVDVKRFSNVPGRLPEDEGFVNVGAVLRVTPIKDVKTMILAFAAAIQQVPNLKLWIMGPMDEDPEYAEQCKQMVESLKLENVIFTGRINTTEYIGRMDMTILTSISEGMPLTILEGFAAKKPAIATDVGNCRELLYGADDDLGIAGVLCHIMNIDEIALAMIELGSSEKKRLEYGENGFARVNKFFKVEQMKKTYAEIYDKLSGIDDYDY